MKVLQDNFSPITDKDFIKSVECPHCLSTLELDISDYKNSGKYFIIKCCVCNCAILNPTELSYPQIKYLRKHTEEK